MKISRENIIKLFNEFSDISHCHEFLSQLGKIIRDEFSGLRLIGEIERPEGKATYETLKDALKKIFRIQKMKEFDPDYFDWPDRRAVITLYFVWAGVFNYGAEGKSDLWPHIFHELEFDYNKNRGITSHLGRIFLQCLKENNLELFPNISGHVYVNRILLHGLIPEKHIRKFIESYILGEFSAVKAKYYTGQTLIKKWAKSSQLQIQPVPIQNFILHGSPINADVVDRFWEMIENWEEEGAKFWQKWRLPKYMVDAFKFCIDSPNAAHIKNRAKKKLPVKPCLMLNFQENDFPILYIPPQSVPRDSQFKIEWKTLNGQSKVLPVKTDAIPRGDKWIFQGEEISISPSEEWTVLLPDKSQTLVYQFPFDDSNVMIPVYLFNNATGKAVNFNPGRPLPKEIMAVFPGDARLDFKGAEMPVSRISLSNLWHDWDCAIYQIQDSCEIVYKGPDIRLSRNIETRVSIFGAKDDQDIPVLECGRVTPSWIETDGNIPVIADVETLLIRFSHAAEKTWRRGMGRLVRLDAPDRWKHNSYFNIDLRNDEKGSFLKPDWIKQIDPGVYEISIRGPIGVEDVILPFVYLPISKFERRVSGDGHEIVNRFILEFTVPMATNVHGLENTTVQWHKNTRAVIKFEEDHGEAFCALKIFDNSGYPVTLLLARSDIRWVRRSEGGFFHWYDWRAVAEEIPVDRLNELQDTRVLVEIDDLESNLLVKLHKKSNRLRLLLKNMTDGSKYNYDVLMSFDAPNYKRGFRNIWVLDLHKFADQMTSVRKSGHAILVLDTVGLYPKIVLFQLLRYSDFKDFRVNSKQMMGKKEVLEVNWTPHPNEARKNRIIKLIPPNTDQPYFSHNLPDDKQPPITLNLDAPEKPEILRAKIEVRRSRFSGRFAEQLPNASCQWLRMPENWVDWPEIPEISHDKLPSGFSEYIQHLGEQKAWLQMPWSSFLIFFHGGCRHNHIEKLTEILGMNLMKRLFPLSKGNIFRIRSGTGEVARLRILSDIDIKSKFGATFDFLPPSEWCRIPEQISFDFSLVPISSVAACSFIQKTVCSFRLTGCDKEPFIKTCNGEFPFSQWLVNEKGFKESGSIIPEIPIRAIWANPPTPDIVKRINREDLFSYETICLEDNLDGIKPLNKNLKHFQHQPTAMAEAFAECIGNKKAQVDHVERFLPRIEKNTRKAFHSLIARWKEWSRSSAIHKLVRLVIEQRLEKEPLHALSGAAALMSRFQAHDYQTLIGMPNYQSLFSETRSFAAEFLPKSFLRDLIISEILISWYWNKRYLEFKAAPSPKMVKVVKNTQIEQPLKPAVKPHCKEESDQKLLKSIPRTLNINDVNNIWKNKGFFRLDSKSAKFFQDKFQDKNDGTILNLTTGLMWQKDGSEKPVSCRECRQYIDRLNRDQFAGYNDWRLPTLEELCSLLAPSDKHNPDIRTAHYVSSVFSKKQIICWSSDMFAKEVYWFISYFSGKPGKGGRVKNHVRAVRGSCHAMGRIDK